MVYSGDLTPEASFTSTAPGSDGQLEWDIDGDLQNDIIWNVTDDGNGTPLPIVGATGSTAIYKPVADDPSVDAGVLLNSNPISGQYKASTNNWPVGEATGYMGFSFTSGLSLEPTTTLYGWAQFSYDSTTVDAETLRLVDYAYEDSGLGIFAGTLTAGPTTTAVPEPGTAAAGMGAVAALLAGSQVMMKRRRERQQNRAA